MRSLSAVLLVSLVSVAPAGAADSTDRPAETAAQRGYRLLSTKAYLPPDFDQQVFDELWKTWEEPLRSQAERAASDERRRMAYARYGLTSRPEADSPAPLQYNVDARGRWVMNCLACHGGQVAGRVVPGLPNSNFALQTLTEDVRATKLRLQKRMSHMDLGSLVVPLGGSNGTTNAVMFGKLLMAFRDAELNVVVDRLPPPMTHHDLDAPPLWNVRKKSYLYLDGFAPKGHRALMQFLLVKQNGPDRFRQWEDDYRDILAWIESLEPPKYPWTINQSLAEEGRAVFNRACAGCHGSFQPDGAYPEKHVPLEVVGTDPLRFESLSPEGRAAYGASWLNHFGQPPVIAEPAGYVAPPLDGIWASAPYLHNGSVPTLWHLLNSQDRPVVWRRTRDGYDQQRVGLEVTVFDELPADAVDPRRRRQFFDTRLPGKSAAGHTFPDALSEAEKRALLEYLKTL